eukprot:4746825-Amphidinium_carterae.2
MRCAHTALKPDGWQAILCHACPCDIQDVPLMDEHFCESVASKEFPSTTVEAVKPHTSAEQPPHQPIPQLENFPLQPQHSSHPLVQPPQQMQQPPPPEQRQQVGAGVFTPIWERMLPRSQDTPLDTAFVPAQACSNYAA